MDDRVACFMVPRGWPSLYEMMKVACHVRRHDRVQPTKTGENHQGYPVKLG